MELENQTFSYNCGLHVLNYKSCDETKAMLGNWCDALQKLERRAKRNLIIRHIIFSVIGGVLGFMVSK